MTFRISMKKTIKLTVFLTLVIFMTACRLTGEKRYLNGSWKWEQTIQSTNPLTIYNPSSNPCNQYLNIRLVFAGNHFIFYKDNVVISTGMYKADEPHYVNSVHNCVITIPEKKCKEIKAATNGAIAIANRTNVIIDDKYLTFHNAEATMPYSMFRSED